MADSAGVAGFLNLYKPRGPTSHDIVARVRRLTGVRRTGHAGTLDPLAEGVLVLALGRATRLLEYVSGGRKVYRATIRLGSTTTTDDAEGDVLVTRPVAVAEHDLQAVLGQFVGEIEQRPPAFSAVQVGGRRAYHLARQGRAVALPPRRVHVFDLTLLTWRPPNLEVEVRCGPGTYIRALARDLGEALGCGGHLTALVRTRSGRFAAADALSLETLECHAHDRTWPTLLIPPGAALSHLPALEVTSQEVARLRQGQPVSGRHRGDTGQSEPCPDAPVRVLAPDGTLVAIAMYDHRQQWWRPHKVVG